MEEVDGDCEFALRVEVVSRGQGRRQLCRERCVRWGGGEVERWRGVKCGGMYVYGVTWAYVWMCEVVKVGRCVKCGDNMRDMCGCMCEVWRCGVWGCVDVHVRTCTYEPQNGN